MKQGQAVGTGLGWVLGMVGLAVLLAGCGEAGPGRDKAAATFVAETSCAQCHGDQFEKWRGSHHDLAMDAASDTTVLGDFDNATFAAHGVVSTFFKRDQKYFVRTDNSAGEVEEFAVSYVFGVTPLQQYLVGFPDGRLQVLDIAWDTRPRGQGGQRWYHLHPDEKITADHPLHWTGRFLNWNYMCAECHTTNLAKNYDPESDTFQTSWSRMDVGCQACHGPGSDHVAWAQAPDKSPWRETNGLVVSLSDTNPTVQVDACARCHARRSNVSADYHFGSPLMDAYEPQVLVEPFYYPDGQVRDEDYVYGSFVQSRMHRRGVRCTDCHDPHTARLKLSGNAVCVACHNAAPQSRFPGLQQKVYDSPEHHFHAAGSGGARCVSCHMPATTYMGVDVRRDHSFRIPRPDLSVRLGTPNACTACHAEKTANWAADRVAAWYPIPEGAGRPGPRFAQVFADAQRVGRAPSGTADRLRVVAADTSETVMVRATAVHLLAGFPGAATVGTVGALLADPAPLLRYHALQCLDSIMQPATDAKVQGDRFELLAPLLGDPVRAVWTEAALALSDTPRPLFSPRQLQLLQRGLAGYQRRQHDLADRPESYLNLGLLHQRQGEPKRAAQIYRQGVERFPGEIPARFNLANLSHLQGDDGTAEALFREVIALEPDHGDAHYSLGMLLAELGRIPDAATELGRAADLLPGRPRTRYNFALSLKQLGRDAEALQHLRRAVNDETRDPMLVYVLTVWLAEAGDYEAALIRARQLVTVSPDQQGAQRLLEHVRAEQSRKRAHPRQ